MSMTRPKKASSSVLGLVAIVGRITNLVSWHLARRPATPNIPNECNQASRSFCNVGEGVRSTSKVLWGSLARMALTALSAALMPAAAHANGNMVDSFTYNGSQPGFTPGSVYALSIAGTELNVCMFTPVSGTAAPSVQYTPSCQNTLAPPDSNSYTAVAYLGTTSNTSNFFAVGDSAGNVYVMQIQFNSGNPNPISVIVAQTLAITNPDDLNEPCGQISSLAVDPDGNNLYIGCVSTKNNLAWRMSRDSYYGGNHSVTLAVTAIQSAGYLSQNYYTIPFANLNNPNNYWVTNDASSYPASLASAVAFPANGASGWPTTVNPKMRVYPPNYPGLSGTSYYSTGAVLYSGLVSGFSGDVPINSAFICSRGICEVAYNIALSESGGGAVFTAAEYGINQGGNPVLYWNQVQGLVENEPTPFIPNTTRNAVVTCQLSAVISSAVTTSPCSAQANIQWPPANVPSSTVWLDQFVFSPTPSAVIGNTSYTQGLLQISAWNDGYLAYYDVASGSNVPGVFFSNNQANGEVGANVQGLSTDSNGNLLIQAGASGLLGFNAFPTSSTNIETQTDVTYVPIPADTNAANSCGLGCKVTQGLGIVASVITDISVVGLDDGELPNQTRFALHKLDTKALLHTAERFESHSSSEPNTVISDDTDLDGSFRIAMNFGGDMSADVFGPILSDSDPSLLELAALSTEAAEVQCCDSNSGAPNPALANFLGPKPYWGSFTYTEQQLRHLGIRPGDKIKGMQLRLAEGISAQPKQTLRFKNVQIALKSGATAPSAQAGVSFESIVFRRSLSILRCSYNRSVRDGYGPVISFGRPYRYLGGNLTLTLRHSGSGNSKRFYLDAFGGIGVIGSYAELSSVWSQPTNVTELKVAPQIKLIKKGTSPQRVKYPSRCG